MANTKTNYTTEQQCLNDLIAHKIVAFEDNVKQLRPFAFYNNPNIKHIKLPNVTQLNTRGCDIDISGFTFSNCENLEDIDFNVLNAISWYNNRYHFSDCPNLAHLILRKNSKVTYSNSYDNILDYWTNMLYGTAIHYKNGAIYVPENLVEQYQQDIVWGQYFIVPIPDISAPASDFLKTTFDTISDDWATIVRNCNINNIDQYKIGDSKVFHDINGNAFYAELVGKNQDTIVGGRTAPTSWIIRELYPSSRSFSSSNKPWETSNLRADLNDENEGIISLIDENALINNIKTVIKTSWNGSTEVTTNDKIWIPSIHEILGITDYEKTGADYSSFFTQHRFKRIKYITLQGYNNLTKGNVYNYWTRSSANTSSSTMYGISTSGTLTSLSRGTSYPYCFGFCI